MKNDIKNKTKQRVSIINQDTDPIIMIKKQHSRHIFKTGMAGFALGFTLGLFVGLFIARVILMPWYGFGFFTMSLIMFGFMLLGGLFLAYKFLKSEKDLKPFYFQVKGEWYSLWWHNNEKQAIKGKHTNLYIQITMSDDKNDNFLRFSGKEKMIYETDHLSSNDISQIRGYLKKHHVELPY